MNTLLLTSLLISLFCVGLRIISSKGMILRFLRKPYELLGNNRSTKVAILKQLLSEKVESKKKFDEYAKGDLVNVKELVSYKDLAQGKFEAYENYRKNNKNYIFWSGITLYIMKPIIGCCTCMASVWTLVWWRLFDDWSVKLILVMFIVAALNSIIYALYEKLSK